MKRLCALLFLVALIAGSVAQAKADRHDFTIYNETTVTFQHVYGRSRDGNFTWSVDLLGQYTLSPGYHYGAWLGDYRTGCVYDFEAFTPSGAMYGGWADLCESSTVYFYDENYVKG